jgi:hypothetical protein
MPNTPAASGMVMVDWVVIEKLSAGMYD